MDELKKAFLNTKKDGETFTANGKKYMRITAMVILDIATDKFLFFGLDF